MCDMQEQDVNSISTSLQALYFKTSHFVVHVKFACTHECYVVSVLSFRLSLSLSLSASLSLCLFVQCFVLVSYVEGLAPHCTIAFEKAIDSTVDLEKLAM